MHRANTYTNHSSLEELTEPESLGAPDLVLKAGKGKALFRIDDLPSEIRHIQQVSHGFPAFQQHPQPCLTSNLPSGNLT